MPLAPYDAEKKLAVLYLKIDLELYPACGGAVGQIYFFIY